MSYISVPKVLSGATLALFFLFLVCGNSPRLFNLAGLNNNLLVTELVLYPASFLCLFYVKLEKKLALLLLFFTLFVFVSFFYGAFLNGFDLLALFYSLRLIAFLGSGIVLGQLCVEKWEGNLSCFLDWLLDAYVIACVMGCGIYILFPDSELLWFFLEEQGIKFFGDPHQQRFVSIYFDPNFYAAIACIPFMIAIFLLKETAKLKYGVFACLFAGTIFLTHSRSGAALFLIVVACLCCLYLRKGFVVKTTPFRLSFFFLLIVVGLWICWGSFLGIVDRLVSLPEDPSADARWGSFQSGCEQIAQAPLFGVGYPFLHVKDISLDASLLIVMTSFGVCGFLGLVFAASYYLYKLHHRYRLADEKAFVLGLIIYILASIGFFSFFNHLLFYPFWALPVVVLCTFLSLRRA